MTLRSLSGAPIANADLQLASPYAATVPCANTCYILGSGGHYEFDVSAPGFATAHQAIDVPERVPSCGCVQVDTQHLTVTLSPSS